MLTECRNDLFKGYILYNHVERGGTGWMGEKGI